MSAARYPNKTGPHVERLVSYLLAPPGASRRPPRLEHAALAGYMELYVGDVRALVTDDDLNDLFVLISDHFAMEPTYSLGEHLAWCAESNQDKSSP